MAYEPLKGWIQVVKANGTLRMQRMHSDLDCGKRATRDAIAKGFESHLVGPYTYGEARRFKNLSVCKCGGGRRRHPVGSDRRYGEVSAGSQGTGRRR